tara:strand:- start:359 stop:1606 length:1248 start_codon:yes stop_codon:yes gene_type:complete
MEENLETGFNRRRFISKTALASFATLIGTDIVFGHHLPKGIVPVGITHYDQNGPLDGKSPYITILNDRPVNAETLPHLLNDDLTPNDLFFVRNNGIPPFSIDPSTWTLTIEGVSASSKKSYTIADLKSKFANHTLNITLECGGNGRKEFNPPAKGNQWSTGAVGCAAWTGVKLKDVLNDVGVKNDAVYIGYYGADTHLSGDPNKNSISRGVPIAKAMEEESMIAWAMNGKDIPVLNGHPLRLVFGGTPASCSGKWLEKIVIRNEVHDGAKMGGQSYRVPCDAVAPGTKVDDADMCIIEKMPVKSLITSPKTGATIKTNQSLPLKGHAWTSSSKVNKMEYSIDFGKHWKECTITEPENRFHWQQFGADVSFPKKGYYEVWAKATDSDGNTQPIILPGWNPKGYLNNACHRIAVKVV